MEEMVVLLAHGLADADRNFVSGRRWQRGTRVRSSSAARRGRDPQE
jgi:hypothetical protein